MSCPQIWNIEQEKDREKEKVGGRPANLNEKKGNRDLEQEIKKQRSHFLLEEQRVKICSGGDKMRNASGPPMQGENERQSKKSERERVRRFLHKKVSGSFAL